MCKCRVANYLMAILSVIFINTSCIDETHVFVPKDGAIIIGGIYPRSYEGHDDGTYPDSEVHTVRVLAFDTSGQIQENEFFHAGESDIVRLKISLGTYTIVCIANEPPHVDITQELNTINNYNDLKNISFPSSFFTSEHLIPMISENTDIKVLADDKVEVNGTEYSQLNIKLRRLAARVDVLLKSRVDFDEDNSIFKGISFSNLPDEVPIMHGLSSEPISGSWEYPDPITIKSTTRNLVREFTVTDNAGYFTIDKSLLTTQDKTNGLVWAAKVNRIILPSSFFSQKDIEDNGITFTVNLIDKYSPSAKLEIKDEPNYTLPANAKLDLTGIIKEPLEVNIQPQKWEDDGNNWEIGGSKILNVSHTSADITDLNGIRISFQSNMPRVRVLETCAGKSGVTNTEFNDLANPTKNADGTYTTTRFYYNPATGEGYMDVLVDGGGKDLSPGAQSGEYALTLSADDGAGKNVINRNIIIKVTQEGYRFKQSNWAGTKQYLGAFFRNTERGERVITGQMYLTDEWGATHGEKYTEWEVVVPDEYKDWITLSSTPSFDPQIGTDTPGDPEDYPVVPNIYQGEDGSKVRGKGRLYFRVGMKKTNSNAPDATGLVKPNYFYLNLYYYPTPGNISWRYTQKIYIRQGEDADYLFNSNEKIGTNGNGSYQPLKGKERGSAAVRFAPYNLTAKEFNDGENKTYVQLDLINRGEFVKYPSQAGAYFYWALRLFPAGTESNNIQKYYRRAMHPDNTGVKSNDVLISKNRNQNILYPSGYTAFWYNLWNNTVDAGKSNTPILVGPYKDVFETCPPGYRRPTDGVTNQYVANGPTPENPDGTGTIVDHSDEIANSEFRVSLFTFPYSGDANSNSDLSTIWGEETSKSNAGPGTYPTGASWNQAVANTFNSFYADGFFDRRPIKLIKSIGNGSSGYSVATGTSQIAYGGTLFVNPSTNASLFFPLSGRIDNGYGDYHSRGTTGYYWSSTASPVREGVKYQKTIAGTAHDRRSTNGAWSMEIQYSYMMPRSTYADFAESIRCVKE